MLTFPWHSTRVGETVYHNNYTCTEGNNIERYYYAFGDGGLNLCHHCASLNGGVTVNRLSILSDYLGRNKR
jgi:hypothetical protein